MKLSVFFIPLALLLAGPLAFATPARGESDAQFARANQEFADGKFKEAITDYEAIGQTGDWTAALFYDLGNAYFRTQDFGKAILNYERARALEPNHPEAQANLRIARDEARALELLPAWPDRFRQFVSLNQQTTAAAILFWTGSFLLLTFILSRHRRGGVLVLSLGSLITAALLAYVIFATENGGTGRSLAIITNGDTQARLATADTAATILALPAGSEVKVERQRGDWVYALLPNNLRGWIPAKNVELVRL